MSETEKKSRRKWVIIPVEVSGKGVYGIDFKMPENISVCEGLMLSVVQRIDEADLKHIGEVSLEINSRKVHPFHQLVDYRVNVTRFKKQPLTLEEPLQGCSQITGFYRDYSNKNYTLNIYLACRTKPQE